MGTGRVSWPLKICQSTKPKTDGSQLYFLLGCKIAGGGSVGRYSAVSGGKGRANPA